MKKPFDWIGRRGSSKVFSPVLRARSRLAVAACLLILATSPSAARPVLEWGISCGDGRVDVVLDDFDTPWENCCTADVSIPGPTLRTVAGCNGTALAVDYDLRNVAPPGSQNAGQSWVVLQRNLAQARDLSRYTHLRLAMRGSNLRAHDTLEVKLKDASGLVAVALKSMTDLPVWRTIYLDLRELTSDRAIDLSRVTGFEIAIVRCAGCEVADNPSSDPGVEEHAGTLYLDEFAAVDLKPGGAHRLPAASGFAAVTRDATVRSKAADALLAQVVPSAAGKDLLPAWFPETVPNFNSYAQAEALLVFVYEYQETGKAAFLDAARKLAARLIALQIPAGRVQAGAWLSTYVPQTGILRGPDRASQPIPCDGNETLVQDIDTCEWAGNVGWVLIALNKLRNSGLHTDTIALDNAIDRGAAWLIGQLGRNAAYPNLISLGIEGNISAYFGLRAAGRLQEASLLGSAIFRFGWDAVQRRMKSGVLPADVASAMDVSGSWGSTFLRAIGKTQEALDAQAYAASILRVNSFDATRYGYGDIAGPYTPAVEFSAQAAAAGIHDADFVLQQISSLQIPSTASYAGAFPGALDHWYGGPLSPWNTTMAGVSPTAWVYFAQYRDPLIDLLRPALSLSISPVTVRTGATVTLSARVIPGTTPASGDVYIALQAPGCTANFCKTLFWLGALNFVKTVQPLLDSWPISPFAGPIFSYTFNGSEPTGTYRWLGAFVEPGTPLNLISDITQPSFEFRP